MIRSERENLPDANARDDMRIPDAPDIALRAGGRWFSSFVVVAVMLCCAIAPVAFAQETHEEIWPEVDAYVKISKPIRLLFTAKPVISWDDNSLSEAQLSANVEYSFARISHENFTHPYDRDVMRHYRLRVGIWEARSNDGAGSEVSEHRLIAEFTPRMILPWGILGAVRNRVDFRWLDGEYSWRYRPRLKLRKVFEIRSTSFETYVSAEPFYDSRFYKWSRSRYQIGIVIPVSDRWVPELYYCRQNDRQPADKSVNVIGPKVTFHF